MTVITPKMLDEPDYHRFMQGDWDERHSTPEARARYGVWRWQGMYEYRNVLLPELDTSVVYDFGGALGPLGLDSTVIDVLPLSIWGHACLPLRSDLGHADVVFTSHTLEHVPSLAGACALLARVLKTDGLFVAHVPHVSSDWWWPQNKAEHLRTFGCNVLDDGPAMVFLADVIDQFDNFDIEVNRRCGDGSMMVIARKYA